jgi:hypothetical protein
MNPELIELCPICIENEALYFTECNHSYCITCLSRINKCAMCRKVLQKPLICSEIKRKVKIINNTYTYKYPYSYTNFQNYNIHVEECVEYIFPTPDERRRFVSANEYLFERTPTPGINIDNLLLRP